ncbi:stage V sporulation protein AA [Pseudogracilibacillus auburnensis]|uniref:Stage V sporulation protein AA n=1 Tax=Pseudogracilibacillus auburnensis TaxID=1494959 RepID=A0A2V3W6D5_9BACI|nr:stage V sporulation protein AA [Pseudogracilibacillus auburnensis]MBO1003097.1 stage V sporulation protein AA [Pseudogracilibacillus auburnensis]PXW88698.1 stage V sporulation protein AA [Pseudogracilibacillus auburnensis]
MATNIVYLRMKKKITVVPLAKIVLKDVALLTTNVPEKEEIENIQLYHLKKEDNEYVVIDSFIIIKYLNQLFKDVEFQLIGLTETIIQVKEKNKKRSILFICLVWLILFIGTAMTIMNFHYDVSMQEVQQKLHYILTGERTHSPLWIQIPYSLGLGIGMILFLNHWFKTKINEEPSPLEVEIYNYQKKIDDYISYYENDLNDEHKHI